MDLDINENLEVVNIDMARLQTMKKNNNTIENGAISVLEGLEEFCNVMLENYKDRSYIPYDKLFCALKQVISTSLENESVLYAVLTGVINEKKKSQLSQVAMAKPIEKKKPQKRNKAAISNYAKSHKLIEIVKHFEFDSVLQARNYLTYWQIPYVREQHKATTYDIDKLRAFASQMKGRELAKMYGVSINAMFMLCKRHNIEYRK